MFESCRSTPQAMRYLHLLDVQNNGVCDTQVYILDPVIEHCPVSPPILARLQSCDVEVVGGVHRVTDTRTTRQEARVLPPSFHVCPWNYQTSRERERQQEEMKHFIMETSMDILDMLQVMHVRTSLNLRNLIIIRKQTLHTHTHTYTLTHTHWARLKLNIV